MIAIETLLNTGDREDKFSRSLYTRLNAIFGWIHKDTQKLRNMSERIYQLRCEFVHQGEYKNVTIQRSLGYRRTLAQFALQYLQKYSIIFK